jgi:outer membrane protein
LTFPAQKRLVALIRAHTLFALVAILLSTFTTQSRAQTEPLFDTLELTGDAGLGIAFRSFTSPYDGVGQVNDMLPLWIYEGKLFYLHGYRAGFRVPASQSFKFDVFIAHRFEGFPYEETPASLEGMEQRNPGVDGGIGVRYSGAAGNFAAELRQDISVESNGAELSLGYDFKFRSGPFLWRPYTLLSFRNSKLNNYYYGVRPEEATVRRPAYAPGDGYNFELGFEGQYNISRRWRLLAGIGAVRLSSEIQDSPIVDKSWQITGFIGALYDIEDEPVLWAERKPVLVRVFYGASTDCILNQLITFRCASISTEEDSRIAGVHLGRTFVERINDWPLDFVGYAGVLHRNDQGLQPDSWQIDAYMKPYWYGFPWSDTLGTRIGFGIGLSWASRVPYVEQRDQTAKGQNTSKLLSYLDPSIEINIGDLFRAKRLEETWLGVGVSHRSGAFGSSQLLGNVDGGSNYIYASIESAF